MKNYFWPALAFILTFVFMMLFGNTIYLTAITDSPPYHLLKEMEEQIECARNIGLKIRPPILRMMKVSSVGYLFNGYAYDIWPNGLIALAPHASERTMAHELGHILDYQTDRWGHPLVEQLKGLSMEAFADAIRDKILIECQKPKPA